MNYLIEEESPRETCANLCQAFRAIANDLEAEPDSRVDSHDLRFWASRLERAVQKLDAEKSPPPRAPDARTNF